MWDKEYLKLNKTKKPRRSHDDCITRSESQMMKMKPAHPTRHDDRNQWWYPKQPDCCNHWTARDPTSAQCSARQVALSTLHVKVWILTLSWPKLIVRSNASLCCWAQHLWRPSRNALYLWSTQHATCEPRKTGSTANTSLRSGSSFTTSSTSRAERSCTRSK